MVKLLDFGSVVMFSDGIFRFKVNKCFGRVFDGRFYVYFLE